MPVSDFMARHRAAVAQLNHAYAAGDEASFELVLEELFDSRRSLVLVDVQRLSASLLAALTRFRSNSRVATLAVKEIPDARLRLDHVLTMTEEAAHKTLDIIEQSAPIADATARGATELANTLDDRSHNDIRHFLDDVRSSAEQVRRNLTEVMLVQGFQDLTGQILRGVRTLIIEVEAILDELMHIAGMPADVPVEQADDASLEGPAVPGIARNAVTEQHNVDDLMADLGI